MGSEVKQVQSTNDSSIVSKCSMVGLGYFQDDFLKCFVTKQSRRAPLINRGYYVRAKAVDHCLKQFLLLTKDHPVRQILSLGAGFDSLYFRLKACGLLEKTVVIEIDFPAVVHRKRALIRANQELAALVGSVDSAESGLLQLEGTDYKLLAVDLNDLQMLDLGLTKANFNPTVPTLVLSEVVITYLTNERSSALIKWAADSLSSAVFVIYEQICPDDPFGLVMRQHFRQLNSTLHAVAQYPDAKAQWKRFAELGWEDCTCIDMNEFYFGLIPEEERRRTDFLEPFDEYEEWHLKCSHYFILSASKGEMVHYPLLKLPADFALKIPVTFNNKTIVVSPIRTDLVFLGLKRYGHRSSAVVPHIVITTGGYGESECAGQHSRLKDIHCMANFGDRWISATVQAKQAENIWGERMFHSMTMLSDQRCIVIGGRSSPLCAFQEVLCCEFNNLTSSDPSSIEISAEAVDCSGKKPSPRWRHSAAEVIYKDRKYLFVYGGRSSSEMVLTDCHFLDLDNFTWVQIPVEGPYPEGRHSHTATCWNDSIIVACGLGKGTMPLGCIYQIQPTDSGFRWQKFQCHPAIVPRYSHTAHVIDDKLLLVGGVWIHSDPVPGVTVIDLKTGESQNYQLSVANMKWPLMLHNHSSVLLEEEKQLLITGGGGNCFSFGTHLNVLPALLNIADIL
ncbi:tRNA wybutosine-synthesizing protein 4 [Protopterus annectens]|uniref:tRNA wybutosine-synthesizing protein 4 n=1 Tax=Protopterus annectens TaxID=7888 RepID=UPI001CFBF321|nr:tRNA wybutosine-synthesizing protein 4 [Protopterus annectens]